MYTQNVLFYSLILKNSNILTFPIVKMTAKYAEIGRVGKCEAGFQQITLV